MTDYTSIFTSMSSKFNQGDDVKLNLNEDKTLKWRGLQNNQYASMKRRKDRSHNSVSGDEINYPSDIDEVAAVDPNKLSGTADLPVKVEKSDSLVDNQIKMDVADKLMPVNESSVKLELGNSDKNVNNDDKNQQQQRPAVLSKTVVGAKRVLRRKINNNVEVIPTDLPPSSSSMSKIQNVPQTITQRKRGRKKLLPPTDGMKVEKTEDKSVNNPNDDSSPPKLRRSERMHICAPEPQTPTSQQKTDTRSTEVKVESTSNNTTEMPPECPVKFESLDEKPSNSKKILGKKKTVQQPQPPLKSEDSVVAAESPEAPTIASPKSETPPSTEDSTSTDAVVKVPKKRGRKPGSKINTHFKAADTNVKNLRYNYMKRSQRLSKDGTEGILVTAMHRHEQTNSTTQQNQRLSRRIKPTAKILANEELRQGFEQQNNARMSMSNEHLDESSGSPKAESSVKGCTKGSTPQKEHKKNLFPTDDPEPYASITPPPPARKTCLDTDEFLNNIKLAKINLNRSPEDNKKLNGRQKKRLIKMKVNHLQKLGLQPTSRINDSTAESEGATDDNDEFVPTGKLHIVKRSVNLRVRSNTEHRTTEAMTAPSISPSLSERNPMIRKKFSLAPSCTTATVTAIKREISQDATICLCNKTSKYFANDAIIAGSTATHCAAIDHIEPHHIGCSNTVDNFNLLRPSTCVSYMLLCESHRKRLQAHNCCAGCGLFLTQGHFMLCERNHLFHKSCAAKFILTEPYDRSPTLVRKCPHCSVDAPDEETSITMKCANTPVFMPSQRSYLKAAKISAEGRLCVLETTANDRFLNDIERLLPDSIQEILIQAQHNVPFSGDTKYSTKALFHAINENVLERVAEIIASGFDITLPMKEFQNGTCLHLVANVGSIEMAFLLLSRVPSLDFVNVVDRGMKSALMCAVVGDKHNILGLLVQCGADVTMKGPNGMTALHLAAKRGDFRASQILLNTFRVSAFSARFEAYINSVDDGGWTALVWACELGHSQIVTLLLNCGADVNICDTENKTALHWCVLSDKSKFVIQPLLRTDCDVNAQDINGDAPLHIACRQSNTAISLLLLIHGADLDIKNSSGQTPIDCVPDEGSQCARALLFNRQVRRISGFSDQRVINHDISNGRELYPIKMIRTTPKVNELEDIALPDFKYITKCILMQNSIQIDSRVSQMRVCSCSDSCTSDQCQCGEISGHNWYNTDGRINGEFDFNDPAMIFECNDVCGCNKLICKNRVVQNGSKVPLQVFECEQKVKGWGVRALIKIVKGTFVMEYAGEILTETEADRRTDDNYFFDLGTEQHCIDSNFYGNVSRFLNHSCEPNVVPIRVYIEHQDLRFPRIAFFASRDIAAGEEIATDYGEKFWLVKYQSVTCCCMASSCRYSVDRIAKTVEELNQRSSATENF